MTDSVLAINPEIVVGIDPGLRECGVSIFRDEVLIEAHLVRNPNKRGRRIDASVEMAWEVRGTVEHYWISSLVLEHMVIRGAGDRKGRNNDVLALACVGGAIAGLLDCVTDIATSYLPEEWKGKVPKKIHQKRILDTLSPREMAIVDALQCPRSLTHNVVDAIGIGLYHLERGPQRKTRQR